MLTKAQQAYVDEIVARAGKPNAALQLQIDRIRAAKTQDDLTEIFLRDANVVRPKIEAELLCGYAHETGGNSIQASTPKASKWSNA